MTDVQAMTEQILVDLGDLRRARATALMRLDAVSGRKPAADEIAVFHAAMAPLSALVNCIRSIPAHTLASLIVRRAVLMWADGAVAY